MDSDTDTAAQQAETDPSPSSRPIPGGVVAQIASLHELVDKVTLLGTTHECVPLQDIRWHKRRVREKHDADYLTRLSAAKDPARRQDNYEATASWIVLLSSNDQGLTHFCSPVHPDWVRGLSENAGAIQSTWSSRTPLPSGQTTDPLNGMSGLPVLVRGTWGTLPLYPQAWLFRYVPVGASAVSTSLYPS